MRIAAASCLALLTLLAGVLHADGPPRGTPEQQYRAVLDNYNVARHEFAGKTDGATTEEERKAIRAQYPSPENYYARLLVIADAYPKDPAAVDALVWIAATSTNGFDAFKDRGPRIKRAMDILARDHVDDPRVGRLCLALVAGPAPLRDEFLHTIHARATDRAVKGRACMALGKFMLLKSDTVTLLKGPTGPDLLKRVAADAPHRTPYLDRLLREDAPGLAKEGERLLELAIAEYGDLPHDPVLSAPEGKTLADVARADLRRLRHLAVGQEAPEIDGKDVEGKPFRLSDHRGRVVLLTFSGNWCGPCRAMYPAERALVDRLKGRPFAMLSVNTDADPETLRKSIAAGEITWRCWWESGVEGPICTRWMVEGFPQVYLIDHKGLIRSHGLPSESDRTIDDLVKACEAETRASR